MLENGRLRFSSRGVGVEKASAEALETFSTGSPLPPPPSFPSMLWILSASSLMYLWPEC